jgi:hypothetical protein
MSWSRSLGEIAVLRLSRATRWRCGVGCSRNWRNRLPASSRSGRAAGVAHANSPSASPTTSGSTPDSSRATQIAVPITKDSGPRRTLNPTSSSTTTANRPKAQISAATSISSL